MADSLCLVCNAQPKKYKCPTCSIPYCSLPCFKLHKPTHENPPTAPITTTTTTPTQPALVQDLDLPQPPQPPQPPAPPRYLKQKTDFTRLSADPKFAELLKTHPALLASLQRVYAATLEPEPEEQSERHNGGFNSRGGRGRGYQGRGRGRGRGFGGRGRGGGFNGDRGPPKWSEKKGDADALRLLKRFRDGKEGDGEKDAMGEFTGFVEECLGEGEGTKSGEADRMQMG